MAIKKIKPTTAIYVAMAVCAVLILILYPISVSSSMSEVSWCEDSCIKGTYITSVSLFIIIFILLIIRFIINS